MLITYCVNQGKHFKLLVSAKMNGHNEHAYLRHVLEKLPLAKKAEDYEALLPHVLSHKDIPAFPINQPAHPGS